MARLTLKVKLLFLIGGIFLLSLVIITGLDYWNLKGDIVNDRLKEAQDIRSILMSTRRIYHQQFIDSGLPLNDKTIGFLPAHALGRISRDFTNWSSTGMSFNNVSDRPRNPDNGADGVELEAIAYFRENPDAKERVAPFENSQGRAYLHFSTPIYVETYCLKCHGDKDDAPKTIRDRYDSSFDYQKGDLRGVMSIKLPIVEMTASVFSRALKNGAIHLITFLIAFIVIYWLLRRTVLNRLNELLNATERVQRGDYRIQLSTGGDDEFGQLLSSFSKMARAIDLREDELTAAAHNLRGRNKELVLLYRITDLLDEVDLELGETLQLIVNLMPSAWQDPAIASACITYGEYRYLSKGFSETAWKESASIRISGQKVGHLCIFYDTDPIILGETHSPKETGSLIDKVSKEVSSFVKRREAESDVRKLLLAVEQSPASMLITDTEGVIEYVNATFERVTGYTREEVIGENPRFLKSGKVLPETYRQLWHTIKSGQEWQGELHNRRKNGELYWEAVRISPVKENDGSISHFLAIKEDVTAQKLTEEALRRSQKMDAIGQLTGGIAHDFNNLLGIIIGNLGFLRRLVAGDEKSLKRVETTNKAALRAADLTKQLLGFSRKQAQNTQPTDLNQLIREMDSLIARSVTPEVSVDHHLSDDLWPTEIDPGDFQDALLNLILNARDAMPDGGRLTIETNNKVLDATYAALNPGVSPGDYVQLALSDTGCGIPADMIDRIFEPFFTTKSHGKGTGLGLSMVFGCMERSNGAVKAYSEPGVGTTIRLLFPRLAGVADARNSQADQLVDLPRGEETILIVDDEEELVELAQEFLEELGYRTITAKSGGEAMEMLMENLTIDLLFSDVVMPGGMNGYELATRAKEKKPALKVLLTSGFTRKAVTGNGQALFSANLLTKPYSRSGLAFRMREILDEVNP